MQELGYDDLDSKIMLAECSSEMLQMADKDEDVTSNFKDMINANILTPHLQHAPDKQPDDVIKVVIYKWII